MSITDSISRFAVFFLSLAVFTLSAGNAQAASVPSGSFIIPMDNTLVAASGGQTQVLKAYGLVYAMLANGIPVQWSFSTTKSHNGTDFSVTANAMKSYPGGVALPAIDYKGSQFIIDAAYAQAADAVITEFGNGVSVHQVFIPISGVPVQYSFTDIPKAYIFDTKGGNLDLITAVLEYAGIPATAWTATSSTSLTQLVDPSLACYSVLMIPHDDAMTATTVSHILDFLDNGGNVYLQCHAVEDFENNAASPPHVLTTNGLVSSPDAQTYLYQDAGARMAVGQFMGAIEDEGGAIPSWRPASGSVLQTGSISIAQNSTDATHHKTMSMYRNNNPLLGLVTYQGGHSYTPSSQPNLCRVLLNSFLLPSHRMSCTVLPVELTAFSGSIRNRVVQLRWNTATEKNNHGFEIQRRTMGEEWKGIGFVLGSGTTAVPKSYSFTDEGGPTLGRDLLYRLKQIDRDGSISYSPEVEVRFDESAGRPAAIVGLSPNPAVSKAVLSYVLEDDAPVSITVYDALGREALAAAKDAFVESGRHALPLDLSAMTPGMYYVILKSGSTTSTSKLVVTR